MKLEVEGRPPSEPTSELNVRRAIAKLRSYGPSSFASLTDEHGNYVQTAGGGVTCLIERRDVGTGQHFRAYQQKKITPFADGTALVFGGGEVKLASDEWFTAQDVEAAFVAFLHRKELPPHIEWREITRQLS